MKKKRTFVRYFVVLTLLALVMACASTPKQESAGQYVDDSVITTKVKASLTQDDVLKAFQINVKTYKGVVQLSGFVDSQMTIDKAGQIASGVEGVKSVKNDLIMSVPKKESAGEYVDDSVITTKVKASLTQDAVLKAFQINVKTYKGVVQLSGFVDSQMTIDKAGQIASGVEGVKSVKNDLLVK
jgi:hyperosmotically inducible protein